MAFTEKYAALVGRVFIASLFLYAAYGKITGFAGTAAYMQDVVMWPSFMLGLGIAFELIGGLSLLLGWKTRWGAWALILFTLVASALFHNFLQDETQIVMFLKNLSIIGGLLYVATYGAGTLSIDNRKSA
ncbi:DoxX family protein [Candidatus Parcubacteria bacterium]|nr:DoxX family protein [Candidatus Parcubacteria bacterium]